MKIAVTLLDSYRYWRETEYHDAEREKQSLDEIIARIQGRPTPKSEPMLKGIAFANVLEHPSQFYDEASGNYLCDGFEFDGPSITEFRLTMPDDALKEVWMPRYEYNGNYLVGRADLMWDNIIADNKLITKKLNAMKYDSYEASIQWQAELLMADCQEFKYFVGQGKSRKSDDVIVVSDFQTLTFYRSQETDDRVRQLMNDFGVFARPYLEDAA